MADSSKESGFSVIEILISTAIISAIGTMIVLSFNLYVRMSERNSNNIQAALHLEEASEALIFLRDSSWTDNIFPLSVGVEYYLYWDGSSYSISTEPLLQDEFQKTFVISEVNRDSSDSISESGEIDPNTFLVDIKISWEERGGEESLGAQMLIHNVYDN